MRAFTQSISMCIKEIIVKKSKYVLVLISLSITLKKKSMWYQALDFLVRNMLDNPETPAAYRALCHGAVQVAVGQIQISKLRWLWKSLRKS